MGETDLMPHEVDRLLRDMSARWKGDTYDMLCRNCCHFCNELCVELGVGHLPDWLNSLAAAGAALGGVQEASEPPEANRPPAAVDTTRPASRAPSRSHSEAAPRRLTLAVQGRSTSRGSLASARLSRAPTKDAVHQRDIVDTDVFKEHWNIQAAQVSDILARAKTTGELEQLVAMGVADGHDYQPVARRRSRPSEGRRGAAPAGPA